MTGPSPRAWLASRPDRWRAVPAVTAALVLAFVLGFALPFVRAERLERQLAAQAVALDAARLGLTLGDAVVEAQDGNYEAARQAASGFFAGVQQAQQAPHRVAPAVAERRVAATRRVLAWRDSAVTLLARSDPTAASLLRHVAAEYRTHVARDAVVTDAAPARRASR